MPTGRGRLYNVALTSTQRHDVASTLMRRCINEMYLLRMRLSLQTLISCTYISKRNLTIEGADNSVKIVCFSSEKGSVLKRKNLLPLLSRSFPFRVDPFQKGLGLQDGKLEVTKVVSLVKMAGKNTMCIKSPQESLHELKSLF